MTNPEINGLAVMLAEVDFEKWSWSSVEFGPLTVWRGFPAWWGISPWSSPFWKAEVTSA